MIIEVLSAQIEVRNITSRANGNQMQFREQHAVIHKPGEQYPDKFKISLGKDQAAYPPGNYDLSPDSFYIDKFNKLAVNPRLLARPAEQQKQVQAQK